MPVKKLVGSRQTSAPKKEAAPPPPPPDSQEDDDGASAFDDAKPQGQVDPGKYEAVIEEFVLQEEDEKGQSARIKYGIANEGEFRGQQVTQFYKLFESGRDENNKRIVGKGASFLKKDLAVLGYGDVKFADMEEAMAEIVDNNTGVVITVKQNQQWTNVYLAGLAEDGSSVIGEYLDQRTF